MTKMNAVEIFGLNRRQWEEVQSLLYQTTSPGVVQAIGPDVITKLFDDLVKAFEDHMAQGGPQLFWAPPAPQAGCLLNALSLYQTRSGISAPPKETPSTSLETFLTPEKKLVEIDRINHPHGVQIDIDAQWFSPADLRYVAKRFHAMACELEMNPNDYPRNAI